jgi:hypothetical protein
MFVAVAQCVRMLDSYSTTVQEEQNHTAFTGNFLDPLIKFPE